MNRSDNTVLLTGATGFIAAHVLDILLERGYRVRATVRSTEKGEALLATRQAYKSKVEIAIVKDISILGSFDEAVRGVDYVVHVASPVKFDSTDNERDLLLPAINGTKSVFQAASKELKVKRVVITSSFGAVYDPSKGTRPGYVYTSKDWSPLTYDDGKNATIPANAYRASKVLAEKFAWEYLEKEKPHYDMVTLCPTNTFGPIVHPLKNIGSLTGSNMQLWIIASGKLKELPVFSNYLWVDVRDVALAHVEAMERPEASNKRYALSAGQYSPQLAADIMRGKFDWTHDRVPIGTPGQSLPEYFSFDSTPAITELGITFRKFEETLVETIVQLRQLEEQEK